MTSNVYRPGEDEDIDKAINSLGKEIFQDKTWLECSEILFMNDYHEESIRAQEINSLIIDKDETVLESSPVKGRFEIMVIIIKFSGLVLIGLPLTYILLNILIYGTSSIWGSSAPLAIPFVVFGSFLLAVYNLLIRQYKNAISSLIATVVLLLMLIAHG